MENKPLWVHAGYVVYKLYDYNFLNFTLCMLISLLVNTYTGAPGNDGYYWAIALSFSSIILNLFFMYFQGRIKSWIDQTVVANQSKPAEKRYNTMEDIQFAGIRFYKKNTRVMLALSVLLPVLIGFSLYNFYRGTVIGDPSQEHRAAVTRQNVVGNEIDSILNVVSKERLEIKSLKETIGRLEALSQKVKPIPNHKKTITGQNGG